LGKAGLCACARKSAALVETLLDMKFMSDETTDLTYRVYEQESRRNVTERG